LPGRHGKGRLYPKKDKTPPRHRRKDYANIKLNNVHASRDKISGKKRISGALALLKKMMKWLNGGDHRWPQEKELTPQWTQEEITLNKMRFTKLLAAL